MPRKTSTVSLLRILFLVLAALFFLSIFFGRAQTQPRTVDNIQQPTGQSLEFMIDYMECGLIFNQIFQTANQKERIEIIYPKTIRDFEQFIREKPKSRLAAEAKVRIAELYNWMSPQSANSLENLPGQKIQYKENWLAEANKWLFDVIQNHPEDRRFDYVHGKEIDEPVVAQALYYLGHWNREVSYLNELLNKYPNSEPAKLVNRRLDEVTQEVGKTEFYKKLTQEIQKGRTELKQIELKHSPKKVRLIEIRRDSRGRAIKYSYDDFAWKEIALKIMHLETHSVLIIKAKKVGQKVYSLQPEFVVTIEPRPSGIIWNGRNTAYRVTGVNGSRWAVILNNFPNRLKNGKRKDSIYAPHSTALATNIIVESGRKYFRDTLLVVLRDLGQLMAETNNTLDILTLNQGKLATVATERLMLMEQSDYFELQEFQSGRWPHSPFERVFCLLALNQSEAFSSTTSSAQARGLMQATNRWRGRRPGTWDMVRKVYPWAELPPFEIGSANHKQSVKFAILLQNHHLERLTEVFGLEIVNDPKIELKLAAMYNGGPEHVIDAIRNSRKHSTNWRDELRKLKKTTENPDYLDKLDYLLQNPLSISE